MSLTSTGFTIKRQETYISELQAAFRSKFGADLNVDTNNPDSIAGQLIAIFSERFALLYEMAQDLYDSGSRSGASGIPLDNLATVLGLTRKAATPSTALVNLTGTAALVVPAGQEYATPSGIVFTQDDAVTLDGSGAATGVAVTAQEAGAVALADASITVIAVPLSGLSTVTNPAAATTGTDEETDAELRDRMASASSITGSTTVDAIRSRLFQITDVQSVLVSENATDSTVNGQPPHSIECVVYPDTIDKDVLAAFIWNNKPAGIATYGNQEAVSVVDSQGFSHDVYFSFATAVPVDVSIVLTYDSTYPSPDTDGDAQLKQLVMDYVNALDPGDDLQTFKLVCALASFTGVVSMVVTTKLGSDAGYDANNIVIAPNQVARVSDLADVEVTSTSV